MIRGRVIGSSARSSTQLSSVICGSPVLGALKDKLANGNLVPGRWQTSARLRGRERQTRDIILPKGGETRRMISLMMPAKWPIAGRGLRSKNMFRKAFSANLTRSLAGMAALVAVLAVPANAQPSRVQVGKLACSISAGVGLIVGSQRNVSCNFPPDNGPPEADTGTITKF